MPSQKATKVVGISLKRTHEYSDYTITCRGYEFPIHTIIVCQQSSVIKKAVDGPFKENETKFMDLSTFHPKTVSLMLDFLYSGDYSRDDDTSSTSFSPEEIPRLYNTDGQTAKPIEDTYADELALHLEVNTIGDYLNIPGLRASANKKLEEKLFWYWCENVLIQFYLRVAEVYNGDEELLSVAAESAADSISSLEECESWKTLNMPASFFRKVYASVTQRRLAREKDEHERVMRRATELINRRRCARNDCDIRNCQPCLKRLGSRKHPRYAIRGSQCGGKVFL
ncbi:hypothetical protein KEM54_006305 [Ascosphaera aggregata]|nr:hypothetical protein KEM54_006305 [Ascosphaera aggregata]